MSNSNRSQDHMNFCKGIISNLGQFIGPVMSYATMSILCPHEIVWWTSIGPSDSDQRLHVVLGMSANMAFL